MDILSIVAKDKDFIAYRKDFNQITGCPLASIFLQRIIFRWENNEKKPFYKFKKPCGHEKYKEGDSWVEELGFSISQVDIALKLLVAKGIVSHHTDNSRMTRYTLIEPILNDLLYDIYNTKPFGKTESRVRKTVKPFYETRDSESVNRDSDFPNTESRFTIYPITLPTTLPTTEEEENFANFPPAPFEEKNIFLGAEKSEEEAATRSVFEHRKEEVHPPIEKEKKVAAKKEKAANVVVIPSFEEFEAHGKAVFQRIETAYSVIWAEVLWNKYDTWVRDGWKIFSGRQILNWKSTLSNVITAKVVEINSKNGFQKNTNYASSNPKTRTRITRESVIAEIATDDTDYAEVRAGNW